MIKTFSLLIILMGMTSAWAGGRDMLLSYSTRGTDRYQDGNPVQDGECYALVYTHPGRVFTGFRADGTVADPTASDLALVAPVAKGGRCPPTLFQVRERYAASRTDGSWEVFLIDTRDASGRPAGVDAKGLPRRINRWNRVEGRIRTRCGSNEGNFSSVEQTSSPKGALAGGEGVLPPDVPQPQITGIKVKDDGSVELEVANTVPYVTYDAAGVHEAHQFGRKSRRVAREAKDGNANGRIKIEVPAEKGEDAPRFFKVVRK